MSYATQRDALVRTRQELVVLGVRECQNFYATLVQQLLTRTEELDHADWTRVSIVSVTADNATAPDGTTTADTVVFDATSDAIYQTVTGTVVTSKAFTGSVWLRTASGTSTLSIGVENVGQTESNFVQCSLTTTWQRFYVHFKFTGTPVDDVTFRIERNIGDTATTVQVWGANLHRNSGDKDMVVAFPYRKRVAESVSTLSVNASRCSAADAGDGARCFYSRPTCQDSDNFNVGNTWETTARGKGLREYRFCRNDAPLPFPGEDVRPMLLSYPVAAQEIDVARGLTLNERGTFTFLDEPVSGLWNPVQQAEGALTNTQTGVGRFWRRWAAIYHNFSNPAGYTLRKTGFVESGGTELDFQSRGGYLVKRFFLRPDGTVALECTGRLSLSQATIPGEISDDNLLESGLDTATTTFAFTDVGEIRAPGSGWTVTLELEPDTANAEKVNILTRDLTTNTCTGQRGRWGTTAKAHNAKTEFRQIYEFGTERSTPSLTPMGMNLIDGIITLYRYAGFTSAEIDTATLEAERDVWLPSTTDTTTGDVYGVLVRRTLLDQVQVEDMVRELRALGMVLMWVNDAQVITGKVFAPKIPGVAATTVDDSSNLVDGSVSVEHDVEQRVSRVLLAYDLIAGESADTPLSFRRVVLDIDADAEDPSFYGEAQIKTLLTEWLEDAQAVSGVWREDSTARYWTAHILAQLRDGLRVVEGRVEIKDEDIPMGTMIRVMTAMVQDVHGNDLNSLMYVVKKEPVPGNQIAFRALDVGLLGKTGFYADAGAPVWGSATTDDKEYGYFADAAGLIDGAPGYTYW